jgi:structure-specific recognition protein 1
MSVTNQTLTSFHPVYTRRYYNPSSPKPRPNTQESTRRQFLSSVEEMSDSKPTQFDNVFLNLSKHRGRLRLHTSGLGWKSSVSNDPYTVPASDVRRAIWSSAARGFSLKIGLRNGNIITFDGFEESEADRVAASMKDHFNVTVEHRDHSLKGWNWGKAKFEGNELLFQVSGRPAFEVPFSKVSNTNLVGKTEVAIEFALPKEGDKKEFDSVGDELVEMRFYVPGMKEKEKEGSDAEADEDADANEEVEETSAATVHPVFIRDLTLLGLLRDFKGEGFDWRSCWRVYCYVY